MADAVAAPSERFWELIALTGGLCDEEALEPLSRALYAGGRAEVVAFAADMVLALAAIGTDEHARQSVRDVSEPEGADALPMSDDVFLDARFAVVAAGHEAWHRVVVDPAAFAGQWHVADGELLLALVQEVYGEVVEEDWSPDGVVYSLDSWLKWRGGIDVGVPTAHVHGWAFGWFIDALGKDEAWAQWWATSGRSRLRVDEFRTPHPWYATTVRRRKDRVDVAIHSSCAALHTGDPAALVRAALDHVEEPILAAARKLRMRRPRNGPHRPRSPTSAAGKRTNELDLPRLRSARARSSSCAKWTSTPPQPLRLSPRSIGATARSKRPSATPTSSRAHPGLYLNDRLSTGQAGPMSTEGTPVPKSSHAS